jgi:NAD(P)-dependent dehydrogenase (short-subunit alcohol dehydrogenase family)
MAARLKDKVAIVTGAASGIGAATAAALAAEGACVVLADINLDGARKQAASIAAEGARTAAVALDLGDPASVEAMIRFAVEQFGGLDILDNNAADTRLSATRDVGVEHTEIEVWDSLMRTNLRGTMLACKYAIPRMRARGGGSIINMSSGSGLTGALAPTAYGVSKAGIITLTQYVATQHGKEGIRCNAIAPGLIVTPATANSYSSGPFGEMMLRHHLTPRLGMPSDIAAAVVFLASDEAAFITGQTLCVDGGLLAHAPYHADMAASKGRA